MNKKDLFTYPAIITNEDNKYWVEFIDLKGCYSQGNTLSEAMGLYLEDIHEYPECTENIKNIKIEDNQVISFITVLKEKIGDKLWSRFRGNNNNYKRCSCKSLHAMFGTIF